MVGGQPQPDNLPHDNMVVTVRVVLFAMAITTLVVCLLRLYVRYFIIRSVGLDDIFVIFALIGFLSWHAIAIAQTFCALGRHIWDVSPADLSLWLKEFYVTECIYLTVASILKTSIILLMMRLFPARRLLVVSKCLMAFLVAFTISGTFVLAFQCRPIQAAYIPNLPGAKCISPDAMFGIFMFQAVTMFLTDVVIIAMPMPIIWKLNMPVRRRIVVMALFSLGFIATIAALVRFSTLAFVKGGIDVTYTSSNAYIWMSVEYSLGFSAGSLSSLRPMIRWKGLGLFSTKNSSNPPYGTHSGSRRNPRSSGYARQDCEAAIKLSTISGHERALKNAVVAAELEGSESTEQIIIKSSMPVCERDIGLESLAK
ncbi:hypothetical protein B0J12DRAFT_719378 [Macrophomina phaseolina]|uniref:Rhodopsin domain-containing protein n=1 Tax=Macrophomina phaseolina TaxID=35725 RepID=A0ABQ8GA92_9PEZI|nr:hypothetical protein B0J12DRAFT_719378 [Macrophomina phaseolina]